MTNATLKVLAIEGHEETRNLIVDHLHNRHHVTLHAASAKEGLQLFRREKPDLLLLDLQLPRQGGLKILTEVVRESPSTAVVVMSDHRKTNDAIRALHLGAWDCLAKPVDLDLMGCAIKRAGERQRLLNGRRERTKSTRFDAERTRIAKLLKENRRLRQELSRGRLESERSKEREAALAAATQTLGTIFNRSQTLIAYLDRDCNFIMVNRAYADAENRSPAFFPGKNYFALYPHDENATLFRQAIATGAPYLAAATPSTCRHDPQRGLTCLDLSLVPVKDNAGEVVGLILNLVDVTSRIRLEQELTGHREQLADQVEARTADLMSANLQLQEKIVELERTREELEKNKTLYRRITEATTNYIYTVQAENGRPVATIHRPACEAVTGYTPEEFTADPFLWIKMVPEEDHQLVRRQIDKILQGKTPPPIEHRIRKKDGTIRWINNTAVLSCDEEGKLLSYEGVVQDITDRKRAEQRLQEAHDKLEKRVEERTAKLCKANASLKKEIAERRLTEERLALAQKAAENASTAKSQFLANMSHEIRTPMNAIVGLTDVTLGTDLNDAQRRYLLMVKESAASLLALLNDILDFSKIEAGQIILEKQPFDLQQTLEAVVRPLTIRAHQKGLALLCRTPGTLNHELVGDALRLRQILVNLVGNALKFTNQGQIAINAAIGKVSDDAVELNFEVNDTGIGIQPEVIDTIFDSFTQADASTTRIYGGTGLGLAITRQLVRLMDGEIRVESTVGKGTAFRFTALFGKGEKIPLPALPPDVSINRVLLVDPNADSLAILRDIFTDWGVIATTADSGFTALQGLAGDADTDTPPQLIVLDGTLTCENEFAFLDRFQEHLRHPLPPLILLTSPMTCGEAAKRCHDLANCFFLAKPFSRQELLKTVVAALTGVRPTAGSVDQQGAPPPAPPPLAAPLRVLLAEDNLINSELAQIILEQAGHGVRKAEDGLAALRVLASEDFDLVLMDIQMPRMDGITATRLLRQCEQGLAADSGEIDEQLLADLRKRRSGRHLPVVAMTAHAMSDDRERGLAAGMDNYLTKPFVAEQFLALINGFRAKTPQRTESPSQPLRNQDKPSGDSIVDTVRKHLATEYRLAPPQIDNLLANCRHSLCLALQKAEAALRGEDIDALAAVAHTLKGSLLSLGLAELAKVACGIENSPKRQDGATPPYASQLDALRSSLTPLLLDTADGQP